VLPNGASNKSPLYLEMTTFWLMLQFKETTYGNPLNRENDSPIIKYLFHSVSSSMPVL
jgi:hypothetical protein